MKTKFNFKKISNIIAVLAVIPIVSYLRKAGEGALYVEGVAITERIHNIYNMALPVGLAVLLVGSVLCRTKLGKAILYSGLFILMGALLSWSYMYSIMDADNYTFEAFQHDSEILVTDGILMESQGFSLLDDDNGDYGLRRPYANYGVIGEDNVGYPDDPQWKNGYSTVRCGMVFKNTERIKRAAVPGAYMRNIYGPFIISEVQTDDEYIYVFFDSDVILTEEHDGVARGAELLRYLASYESQYGLQGKIFRKYVEYVGNLEDAHINMRFINSTLMAAVAMLIVFLLYSKYGLMMAGSFYITFLLSQWVTNFGRNLYWVEFTWFIPMAVGIFCSLHSEKRMARIVSYIGAFLSVLVKCLCGYEYLSTIMVGLIAFLLADTVAALIHKEKEKFWLLVRTMFIVGVLALAGFATAICMHADIRGNGDIAEGVKIIIQQDVMRRTHSSDTSMFTPDVKASLESTVKEVVERYFDFGTDVIKGIEAEKFASLYKMALLLGITGLVIRRRKIDDIVLYFVFLSSTLSWHILAKAHSYVHTHMNYVLWYFGFVQICIYLIVSAVPNIIIYHKRRNRQDEKDENEIIQENM